MKVLLVHNAYQQPGGEDQVFTAEANLLKTHGHQVLRFAVHNDLVHDINALVLAWRTVWNRKVYRELHNFLERERPDIVHFHNTFPLISPAAYYAVQTMGIPVVQTLHNYRLLCPNALFYRDGQVCEDCLGKVVRWPSVTHRCYRQSLGATAATAAMLSIHHILRTWSDKVDLYIALTRFARAKFVQGGLPADKVLVKPNFLSDVPTLRDGSGKCALFVGRLSVEKGLEVLLMAWSRLENIMPLKIVGDGPLASRIIEAASRIPGVEYAGRVPRERILTLMKEARFLIFPSLCYEGFPNVIAEAYAAGLPVLASDLGSMSSLIDHGRTGLHFRPGDPDDLITQVEWALDHPDEMSRMGREARWEFEREYSAECNYEMLMDIYQRAIESKV